MDSEGLIQIDPSQSEDIKWTARGVGTFLGLTSVMLCLVGIGTGFAGIRSALLDGGVFSDKCSSSTGDDTTDDGSSALCGSQANSLATIANLAFAICNTVLFIVGIIVDLAGPRTACLLGTVIWTVSFGIMGMDPASGYAFSVGFIGMLMCSGLLFTGVLAGYAQGLFPKRYAPVVSAVFTGCWDLSAFIFIALNYVYYSPLSPSLFALFGIFALVCGASSFCLFFFVKPNTSTAPMTPLSFSETVIRLSKIFKLRLYWLYVLNTVLSIAYGYFWISCVPYHMEWKGADTSTADTYNDHFALFLPLLGGPISLACGLGLDFSNPKSITRLWMVVTVLGALLGIFAMVDGPLEIQYATFGLISLWRMGSVTMVVSTFFHVFPDMAVGGRAFGLMWTISGLITVAFGQVLIPMVADNVNMLFEIHLIALVFNVVVPTLTAWAIRHISASKPTETD